MKCSIELPTQYLEYSDRLDYDYVIASTYLTHPIYREWYLGQKNTERFINYSILDNGAFETGESVPDADFLQIIRDLRPFIVVLPDVAFDPIRTLERSLSFRRRVKYSAADDFMCSPKYMGVIQANGDLTTAIAMGHAYKEAGVDYIGIPYISGLDRYSLISKHFSQDKVHILGCPSLPEALTLCTLPNVVSIDSSLPVKVTRAQKHLNRELHTHFTVGPDTTGLDEVLLQKNIDFFVQACHNDTLIVGR